MEVILSNKDQTLFSGFVVADDVSDELLGKATKIALQQLAKV